MDVDQPFTEDFEDETFCPTCWSTIDAGIRDWQREDDYNHTLLGAYSAYSGYYGDIYLVLPDLAIADDHNDNTDVQLTFWSWN